MNFQNDQLGSLIEHFQQQRPLRAGSLIISAYGDAIVPRGSSIWLGSLIELLAPMGISQRLVRTSVFRLKSDGWLMTEKVGRRSYYSVTGAGRRQFEKAFRRVYSTGQQSWDGSWTLVLLNQLAPEKRATVRQELEHQGFGAFASTVMAHPAQESVELNNTLQELDALDDSIVFETRETASFAARPLRLQVRETWNLERLAAGYKQFLERFRPLWQQLKKQPELLPQECFLARLMLIHEYRKLLLRDPLLPEELQPTDWEGRAAQQLCRNLYHLIYKGAEAWLDQHVETAQGPLPAPTDGFYRRFGGLD